MNPFKFTPYLKSVIWGGERIAALKNIETDLTDIGESWEISGVQGNETVVSEGADKGLKLSELIAKYGARLVGEDVYARYGTEFPLLVKIIDARRDLSVQVHPDDKLATNATAVQARPKCGIFWLLNPMQRSMPDCRVSSILKLIVTMSKIKLS